MIWVDLECWGLRLLQYADFFYVTACIVLLQNYQSCINIFALYPYIYIKIIKITFKNKLHLVKFCYMKPSNAYLLSNGLFPTSFYCHVCLRQDMLWCRDCRTGLGPCICKGLVRGYLRKLFYNFFRNLYSKYCNVLRDGCDYGFINAPQNSRYRSNCFIHHALEFIHKINKIRDNQNIQCWQNNKSWTSSATYHP